MSKQWLEDIRSIYLTALEEAFPIEGLLQQFQPMGRDILRHASCFSLSVIESEAHFFPPDSEEGIPAILMSLSLEDEDYNGVSIEYLIPHEIYHALAKTIQTIVNEIWVIPLDRPTERARRLSHLIDPKKDQSALDLYYGEESISSNVHDEAFYVVEKPSFLKSVN